MQGDSYGARCLVRPHNPSHTASPCTRAALKACHTLLSSINDDAICLQGDSYGVRCLVPPYRLLQLGGEVVLELPLPFWVLPEEDLQVGCLEGLKVVIMCYNDSMLLQLRGEVALELPLPFWVLPEEDLQVGCYEV